jgi:heterotetrameric sarcosine oxidase delta subunit
MSIEIHCRHCGARPLEEFFFAEVPVVPATITDPDERDLERGFMHDNTEGPVVERWFHAYGCRRWTSIERDTRTDEVLGPARAPGYASD